MKLILLLNALILQANNKRDQSILNSLHSSIDFIGGLFSRIFTRPASQQDEEPSDTEDTYEVCLFLLLKLN